MHAVSKGGSIRTFRRCHDFSPDVEKRIKPGNSWSILQRVGDLKLNAWAGPNNSFNLESEKQDIAWTGTSPWNDLDIWMMNALESLELLTPNTSTGTWAILVLVPEMVWFLPFCMASSNWPPWRWLAWWQVDGWILNSQGIPGHNASNYQHCYLSLL